MIAWCFESWAELFLRDFENSASEVKFFSSPRPFVTKDSVFLSLLSFLVHALQHAAV